MIAIEKYPPIPWLLPHRNTMLLVEEIIAFDASHITVLTRVSDDTPFLDGHFPGFPILPGVVLIEMMYQTCALHGSLSGLQAAGALQEWWKRDASAFEDAARNMKIRAVGADKLVFKKPVFPGDTLLVEVKPCKQFLQFTTYEGSISDALTKAVVVKSLLTVYQDKIN